MDVDPMPGHGLLSSTQAFSPSVFSSQASLGRSEQFLHVKIFTEVIP